MKKIIIKYLCQLEGYKTNIKNQHFSAKNMSSHKLFDDLANIVSETQDEIGEICQGIHGQFTKKTIKSIPCEITTPTGLLRDMISTTNNFYKQIKGQEYIGMRSVVESFLGDLNKHVYLLDLTIKEEFKVNFETKMNENKTMKSVKLTENQFHNFLNEAVRRVIGNYLNEADVKGGMYNDPELNFTHFAVNKNTNLIVNGWDYEGYDSDDLKQDKRYYFTDDLIDYGFNPKEYKILSFGGCKRQGINPNDPHAWSNDGLETL